MLITSLLIVAVAVSLIIAGLLYKRVASIRSEMRWKDASLEALEKRAALLEEQIKLACVITEHSPGALRDTPEMFKRRGSVQHTALPLQQAKELGLRIVASTEQTF